MKKQKDKKEKPVTKEAGGKKKKKAGKKANAASMPSPAPRPPLDTAALEEMPVSESVELSKKKRFHINFKALNIKTVNIKALIVLGVVCALFIGFYVAPHVKRANTYKSAITEIKKGSDYTDAREKLAELGDYKNARVLSNYALALKVYDGGQATVGTALDQITICLMAIPDDYAGELSEEIAAFKNQFGGYRQRRDDYSAETAFLHPETATESADASTSRRSNVKHNKNFYGAVEEFYESAQHFWDED